MEVKETKKIKKPKKSEKAFEHFGTVLIVLLIGIMLASNFREIYVGKAFRTYLGKTYSENQFTIKRVSTGPTGGAYSIIKDTTNNFEFFVYIKPWEEVSTGASDTKLLSKVSLIINGEAYVIDDEYKATKSENDVELSLRNLLKQKNLDSYIGKLDVKLSNEGLLIASTGTMAKPKNLIDTLCLDFKDGTIKDASEFASKSYEVIDVLRKAGYSDIKNTEIFNRKSVSEEYRLNLGEEYSDIKKADVLSLVKK